MTNLLLTKNYSHLIPSKVDYTELENTITSKLNLKIKSKFGLEDSYSLSILNSNGDFFGYLYVDLLREKGIWITKITQRIEGKLIYDKEVYNGECDLLCLIASQYKGLFICKKDGLKDSISYSINYDENSADYNLIETLINEIQDPLETIALVQILKDKKNDLMNAFNKQ